MAPQDIKITTWSDNGLPYHKDVLQMYLDNQKLTFICSQKHTSQKKIIYDLHDIVYITKSTQCCKSRNKCNNYKAKHYENILLVEYIINENILIEQMQVISMISCNTQTIKISVTYCTPPPFKYNLKNKSIIIYSTVLREKYAY